jgi:hypothetical protein
MKNGCFLARRTWRRKQYQAAAQNPEYVVNINNSSISPGNARCAVVPSQL